MSQNYGSTDIYESKENVQNLITRIRNNLQNIREITRDLGELCTLLGGPHDSPAKKNKILQLQKRAKDILLLTKSLFDTISELKSNDEATKLAVTKIKEDYNNVVPKYNEIHQMIVNKFSTILQEARNSVSISILDGEESVENMDLQLVKDDEEIKEAEALQDRIRQIEGDLVAVQNMYTEINRIVVEGREEVDKIETNVETAANEVEMGNEQLSNAIIYKKKALKKKICIIVIVLVILAIIGLIIGLSVKSK